VGRKAKNRRQSHGSAWHWKQTDCWYCTHPGTRKRLPLLDEHGQRIRGKDRREAADIALARAKLSVGAPFFREHQRARINRGLHLATAVALVRFAQEPVVVLRTEKPKRA